MRLLRRLWSALRHRQLEADLVEELDFRRTMKQRDLEDRGLDPADAVLASRRALGSVALAQDRSRDVWCPAWLQGLGQDFRLAVRTLRSTPIVTVVVVVSLALGVGANTAIFSLVNSLLLRSLPVRQPERLVTALTGASYVTWDQVRQHAAPFDGALAWSDDRFNVAEQGGEIEPIEGLYVSGDFFSTVGVLQPVVGRLLTVADDVPGGGRNGPVAVISYQFWQRQFGGVRNVIGQSITLEHVPFTIVGVTPREFFGIEVGRTFDVAVPIGTEPLLRGNSSRIERRSFGWLTVMLRLHSQQSLASATATLRGLQPQIRTGAMPQDWPPEFQRQFLSEPFVLRPAALGTSALRRQYSRPLIAVLVIVALVLLIACANVANLLLARTTARRHELSVRVALGASRWRLARLWLVESLLLAIGATAAGYIVAVWVSSLLVAQLSTSVRAVFLDLSLDWRIVTFTSTIAAVTAVLFGTAPALRAAGTAPVDALKGHAPQASDDTRAAMSGWLVSLQVALSLVLVVGAGLFIRTFERLATQPLGFDADRVLVVNANASRTRIDTSNLIPLYYRLANEAAAVPGVAEAAASSLTPLSGNAGIDVVNLPGEAPIFELMDRGRPSARTAGVHFVTPDWFAVYGTPIRAGWNIDLTDTKDSPPVVLVNEAFVRRFFPGGNAIGATFSGLAKAPKTIIGIVGNAAYTSLREDAPATMYAPLTQWDIGSAPRTVSISIRTASGAPVSLIRSLSAALTSIDPNLTFRFRPLSDSVDALLIQERLLAILSGFFGVLALTLAALGLYGIVVYAVSRRRTEIGIRLALGAAPSRIVQLVLSRIAVLVALGALAGAMMSLWASQFVATLLYGLEPHDPATLIGATTVLSMVAALAAGIPAWRASRIDPAIVLRAE
jgi:predicted permease